jgi:serine O-acetyltransferase
MADRDQIITEPLLFAAEFGDDMGRLHEDIRTVFAKDPAARSVVEVLCCYPGLHALWFHRLSHWCWSRRLRLAGRLVSHIGRFLTGIEIHPGATIGRRVFIDHGMGVVIGETAEVGDDVLIYMGVVLGGTSLAGGKRHPTIGDGVVIGSGASVLGPITVGDHAKIGAGSVVIRPVPAGATVVGVPGRIAGGTCAVGSGGDELHGEMPDPMLRVVSRLLDRQNQLEERLRELERAAPGTVGEEARIELAREDEVRAALRSVIDPEVGIDVVDLGLVRQIHVDPGTGAAQVDLVLTTKGCPLVDHLSEQVRRRVAGLPGITGVEVRVLDEPWDWERFVDRSALLRKV